MKSMGRLVPIAEIRPDQRDEMFALMDRYYENVRRETFEADLAEKDWVILIQDEQTQKVKGFSTQMLIPLSVAGRSIRALFSGDTIIDRDARDERCLFQLSGWLSKELIRSYPEEELYWFLISKGYKTYRFLPLFFRDFYPRHGAPTPDRYAAVIEALGQHKFPHSYDQRARIVRAGPHGCRLRPGVADVTAERLADPHVRFFSEINPGHALGDELCCIAPLKLENFTLAAYRAMRTPSWPARALSLGETA